jgi:carnitine O-acetyltransferase
MNTHTGFLVFIIDGLDLAGAKLIKFGIESKHSCSTTSTADFKAKVVESLRDMKALFKDLEIVETNDKAKL